VPYSSDNYTKHTHPNTLYQLSTLRFLRRLYKLFDQAGARSVLEIGCGEGFVLDYLVKRRPEVDYVGADLSAEAVRMARRITAPRIGYACAHGGQMPFADGSFGLVIVSEVLEHVPAPEMVLAEAIRLCQTYLLVSVPLEPYFQSLSDLLLRLGVGHPPGHVNFWTARGLRQWLGRYVRVEHMERSDLYQLALCRRLD
jgi:SAM-dependent methyltransferase